MENRERPNQEAGAMTPDDITMFMKAVEMAKADKPAGVKFEKMGLPEGARARIEHGLRSMSPAVEIEDLPEEKRELVDQIAHELAEQEARILAEGRGERSKLAEVISKYVEIAKMIVQPVIDAVKKLADPGEFKIKGYTPPGSKRLENSGS
ncbi:MAG: hypothetical protein ABIA47_03685 [bacterium]